MRQLHARVHVLLLCLFFGSTLWCLLVVFADRF